MSAPEIVIITKEGCLPCLRIKRIMGELKGELPQIGIREVDLASPEGISLAIANSVIYPPAVFINGTLFAKGKILEEPLRQAVRKATRVG